MVASVVVSDERQTPPVTIRDYERLAYTQIVRIMGAVNNGGSHGTQDLEQLQGW